MRNLKSQCFSLVLFLASVTLVVSNGFLTPLFAQTKEVDIVTEIAPIGEVLDEILKNYVGDPNAESIVEGALEGMMSALDEHSSYISPELYQELTTETEGFFDGIGVHIHLDEQKNIRVFQPIEGSPAFKAGVLGGDYIFKIDDVPTKGMTLEDAASKIRGARGSIVHLTILRILDENAPPEVFELDVKRGKIQIESISEARMLDGGIGYVRITDFKATTSKEVSDQIAAFEKEGLKSIILDLRWNPGGLLTASKEVSELFLPKNSLVTFTKARDPLNGELKEDLALYTERDPIVPDTMPILVLVNGQTASSSEIVTGAMQFYKRAIVVGEKTYGKGSVQTIISLNRPAGSALRLTTQLYYTPAKVTINKKGILPDVEVPLEAWDKLYLQLRESYSDDPSKKHMQNHGSVTGNEIVEGVVEDVQLQKAVEILRQDSVWQNLLNQYHKDTSETQVAAAEGENVTKGKEVDAAH
ncbi:MAG: peptidase S41 [Candidatus Hydrogenedentota bacterium]